MSSQYSSTVNLADTPAHFDPWSKWFLGWINPTDYTGQNVGINLDQAADSGMAARFLANPNGVEMGGTGQYFLVENRQRVKFDSQLPSCGVLIWHIDEARSDNTQEGHTAAMHRLVDLERADNSFPFIDGSGNLVDNINTAGIPYPGTSNNNLFADTTTPTARLYDGSPSGVRVAVPGTGTAACAASMSVNFGLPFAELGMTKTASPNPVVAGEQLDYTLSVTNSGPGTATDVVVTDKLPAGVTYLANSDSCVNNLGYLDVQPWDTDAQPGRDFHDPGSGERGLPVVDPGEYGQYQQHGQCCGHRAGRQPFEQLGHDHDQRHRVGRRECPEAM